MSGSCVQVPSTIVVLGCLAYLGLSPGAGRIWCCSSQREPSASAPWLGGGGGSTVAWSLPFSENEAQWSHGTHALGSIPGADLFLGCPSSLPTVAPRRAGPRETQGCGGGVMHWWGSMAGIPRLPLTVTWLTAGLWATPPFNRGVFLTPSSLFAYK